MIVSKELVTQTIQILEDVLDDCADKGEVQTLLNFWRMLAQFGEK